MQTYIKPGYGYWDTTYYPIGGKFCRAPKNNGVPIEAITDMETPYKGCDATAVTTDGRNVAFNKQHTETI